MRRERTSPPPSRFTALLLVGFALVLASSVALAGASFMAQREIERASNARHVAAQEMLQAERLRTVFALTSAANRGYLLTGEPELRTRGDELRSEFRDLLARISVASDPHGQALVDAIIRREDEHAAAVARAMDLRRESKSRGDLSAFFSSEVAPRREQTQQAISTLAADREHDMAAAELRTARAQKRTSEGLAALSALSVLTIGGAAFLIVRAHRRERAMANAWTRFLSIASHDLKTPLSTLTLRVQIAERLLASGALDEARLKNELGHFRDGVEQMSELVRSVLDLSRLKAGTVAIDPQPVDLGDVVRVAAERLQDSFGRAGVELTVTRAPATGVWDPMRIEQVTTNLLSNALKYGDGKPVEVRVEGEGDWARLSVTDHGKGIPVEEQSRIFRPFARLAHQHEAGHGLGLFIVGSIVEAHGGRVRVESSPDHGSTFTVELPRKPARSTAHAT